MLWQGLIFAGIVVMIGYGICLWLLWKKLQSEIAAVHDSCYPAIYGYAHYHKARKQYLAWFSFCILLTVVLTFFFIFGKMPLPTDTVFPLLGSLCCIIGAGWFFISFSYRLVLEGIIDAFALKSFQLTNLQKATILRLATQRLAIFYGAYLALIEISGLLLLSSSLALFWLFPVFFMLHAMSNVLLNERQWKLINVPVPLEQSHWQELTPRILAWAKRLKMEMPAVYVFDSAVASIHSARIAGKNPYILFLNDLFLSKTDWRQQDALIVMMLLEAGKLHNSFWRWLMQILFRVVLFGCGLVLGATFLATHPPDILIKLLGFVDWLLLVLLLINTIGQKLLSPRKKGPYTKAASLAAEITGDPVAMIVALHTLETLYQPEKIETNLHAVKDFVQKTQPHAAWAKTRVGAAIPFDKGRYRLTVPLKEATSPAPVPVDAYEPGTLDMMHLLNPVNMLPQPHSVKFAEDANC